MKDNLFKGIRDRKPTKCDKCGAEWEMGTRMVGESCGMLHGIKYPFKKCKGKLIATKRLTTER